MGLAERYKKLLQVSSLMDMELVLVQTRLINHRRVLSEAIELLENLEYRLPRIDNDLDDALDMLRQLVEE